ncbi:uncharacterized protein K452DRAFT_327983 [Aplosporella prunicola CBS 121167]|uniref:MARVEL domain-containing protein n=1 Tax=Aplosporella prunicola CBS 121167 TaxID=1176127 RepID=A0A6A6BAI0_9PEZI|nr:uncharacterized protein K452DRAFT_327983 [Aplosporella prunicola CBS 121167]KAF2139511.1 hypothetical protein K452DRAFT_327983 [Aplosporella prunicola CBS 121167]
MAVIWGLDLHDMQWSKFKSSYMWNNEYHLRRTKFIVYQLAMIFCVVSESLGTAVLSDYRDQQSYIENKTGLNASVYNNDYIGAGSYNIFVGVFVATIFGAAFFFDLFWPERYESPAVKLAWRICSVLACIFCLSSAITFTVITACFRAHVEIRPGSDVTPEQARQLMNEFGKGPLEYHNSPRAVASLVFLWPGFIFTVASTVLMWFSIAHDDKFGPKSTHARESEKGYASHINGSDDVAVGAGASDAQGSRLGHAPNYPQQAHTTGQPPAYEGV